MSEAALLEHQVFLYQLRAGYVQYQVQCTRNGIGTPFTYEEYVSNRCAALEAECDAANELIARLAAYDAIIDAQPTEEPQRPEWAHNWEIADQDWQRALGQWELAEQLRQARDAMKAAEGGE